jgi:hypoxanthine phosphoribosyltransferase
MDDTEKVYLSWSDVNKLISGMVPRLELYQYDVVIAITRGGIVPSAEDEERDLDWPVFMQFPAGSFLRGKRVLIVDDIWDRGKQVIHVADRVKQAGGRPYSVVLHYKPHRSSFPDKSPDFYAVETRDWIIYPWEVERGIIGM